MAMGDRRTRESYTVGIICALAIEKAAVNAMLDTRHNTLPRRQDDENDYTLGTIGAHNVVVACLPAGMTGKVSAANVARDLRSSFPIKIGLMVGIGGGVWSKKTDVRLGDVVVSQPTGKHGGVVQFDFGKTEKDGVFQRTSSLNKPPRTLLTALQTLQIKHEEEGDTLPTHLARLSATKPHMARTYCHPGLNTDTLYEAAYEHQDGDTCARCDPGRLVPRPARNRPNPRIHYGNIASADRVMKHGLTRDNIARDEGIICFEMEAAGLLDNFPCVVIRGICDYADSHKNKEWQRYAAASAAAYTRELLAVIELQEPQTLQRIPMYEEGSGSREQEFKLPFSLQGVPLVNKFVPRHSEMEQLEGILSTDTLAPPRRRVVLIHGLGGMGKTQLVVEYARRHQTRYSAVIWLQGDTEHQLRNSFFAFSRRLSTPSGEIPARGTVRAQTGLSEQARDGMPVLTESRGSVVVAGFATDQDASSDVDSVSKWLSAEGNNNWLLIIDNVDLEYPQDTGSYLLEDYLPCADHGTVLVTSRLSSLIGCDATLRIGKVDDVQAKLILDTNAGKDVQDSTTILQRLQGLPLALTQAGSYIRRTGITASRYVDHYDATWKGLMRNQSRTTLQAQYERNILTTWTLSYTQVTRQSEPAVALLKLWSTIDHVDIWFDLVAALQGVTFLDVPEPLVILTASGLDFEDAVGVLVNYSLVDADDQAPSFSMHAVLHQWSANVLEGNEEAMYWRLAVAMVAQAAGSNGRPFDRFAPHARQLCRSMERQSSATIASLPMWIYQILSRVMTVESAALEIQQMYEIVLGAHGINLKALSADRDEIARLVDWTSRITPRVARETVKSKLSYFSAGPWAMFWDLGQIYELQRNFGQARVIFAAGIVACQKLYSGDSLILLTFHDRLREIDRRHNRYISAQASQGDHPQLFEDMCGFTPLMEGDLLVSSTYHEDQEDEIAKEYIQKFEQSSKLDGILCPVAVYASVCLSRLYFDRCYDCVRNVKYDRDGAPATPLPSAFYDNLVSIFKLCQQYWGHGDTHMTRLGRSLLWAGNEEDTKVAFIYVRYARGTRLRHQAKCDLCNELITPNSGRLICKVCYDCDLCESCYETYRTEHTAIQYFHARLRGDDVCKGHPFLAIPSSPEDVNFLRDHTQSSQSWLDGLIAHFSALAHGDGDANRPKPTSS